MVILLIKKFVKSWMIIGTLSHWYSFESAQRELSNEYNVTGFGKKLKCFARFIL